MLLFKSFLIILKTISSLLVSEYDCAYQKNGSEFVKLDRSKSFYLGGKNEIQGFKSSLTVKGKESKNKFKSLDGLIFYVKFSNDSQRSNLSIIKFNEIKGKRKAKSVAEIGKKDIEFASMKIESFDAANKIYKISLLKKLSVGSYCLTFINRNGNGLAMTGMTKFVYDFDITE